jgi:molybdenum-dependent DNA-binding transcriptional regulator ModE
MPLILQPSLDEHTREQIEAHVEEVRARRMVAVIVFNEGKKAKLENELNGVNRKLIQQYSMLEKEIEQLDRLDAKLSKRLEVIAALQQEGGVVSDMLTGEYE